MFQVISFTEHENLNFESTEFKTIRINQQRLRSSC